VGVEDRDWYRAEARPSRWPWLAAVAVLLLVGAWAGQQAGWLPLGREGSLGIGAGPLRGPTVEERPLYAADDPWLAYLADERRCPGGEDTSRPLAEQVETMVCLIDYARARAGLGPVALSPTLSRSAQLKGEEIVRCGVFAHAPCGGEADAAVRALGYRGSFGENLYVADGPFAAPRPALDGWLNSPGHRENLFRTQWRVHSVHARKVPRFREYRDATIWVSQFGDR
jgi:uncharacterized protein YkwD